MTQNPYPDPYSSDQYADGSANPAPQSQPQFPQGDFQQPQYVPSQPQMGAVPAYPAVAVKPTSQVAVWSLVLGCVGVTICTGLPSPIALFLGIKGLQETKADGPYSGNVLAIIGVVLGAIGSVFLLLILAYFAAVAVMFIAAIVSATY